MIATSKALIGYTIAVGTIFIGQTTLDLVIPASRWMDVYSVKISDGVVGLPPAMKVERVIHRPFYGEWTAETEQLKADGSFEIVCQAAGKSNYSPENSLPSNLELNWWTAPTRCELPEGKYRTETVWRIFPTGIAPRTIRVISNVFEIKKAKT